MKSMDELHLSEIITLYYEKHHALRQGDINKILEIKNHCPELFDKEKDKQIGKLIEDAKVFQASKLYKEMKRADLKSKLKVITNKQTEIRK